MPRSIFGSYCEKEPEVTPEVYAPQVDAQVDAQQLRWKRWVDAQLWMHAQQLRWTPQLTSAIARDSVLLIVRYVGAHDLETIWECSKCNPYWYDWYCKKCEKSNTFLYWTPRKHFGHCGMSCGCCLTRAGAFLGCDACDDLLQLKATCPTMRDLLKKYKGT